VDDFKSKFDSLYRLVIVGAKRANQVTKHESHGFGAAARARKPTITALEEVIDGKLTYTTAEDEVYYDEEEESGD
jgi:DNA-directed RNA polymerase omega subunit